MPKLRISGAKIILFQHACMAQTGTTLTYL